MSIDRDLRRNPSGSGTGPTRNAAPPEAGRRTEAPRASDGGGAPRPTGAARRAVRLRAGARGANGNAAGRRVHRRGGAALLVVMFAVSLTLVLTHSFLRSQSVTVQVASNARRADLAQQAALAGASFALQQIESPDWPGVADVPARTVTVDGEGRSGFQVRYEAPVEGDPRVPGALRPFHVSIRSTGTWTSILVPDQSVRREVEVLVRLVPRLPGRTVGPGDSAAASDLSPNPAAFDATLPHAVFSRSTTALTLDPGTRIDGSLWVWKTMTLYGDPLWSATVRNTLLDSLRTKHVSGGAAAHPHPFGTTGAISGAPTIRYNNLPSTAQQADLARLGTTWQQLAQPALPTFDFAAWPTYRLFDRGFVYQAQVLGAGISNVTLRPSATNPLGIYYRNGGLSVADNVTVEGTLVCTGNLYIQGTNVRIGTFGGRDTDGNPLDATLPGWPRLPAIVAKYLSVSRDAQVSIDGAVATSKEFIGAGGNFEYAAVTDIDRSGTATAWPIRTPRSIVQVAPGPSLEGLGTSGNYSIWLADGSSGSWYPIVGVNTTLRQLTVDGEATAAAPVACRIRRTRRRYLDVRGPVCTEIVDLNRPDAWGLPTSTQWTVLHTTWTALNATRALSGLAPIEFVDFLADPTRFSALGAPWTTYGLPLEPTTHLRQTTGFTHRWAPPLFRPFDGPDELADHAGYRWQVVSWRDVP